LKDNDKNKSFAYSKPKAGTKEAILSYRLISSITNYNLLEIDLKTGRHHQIRCQLAKIGCPIRGDLKYGFSRSNPNGGISLHARKLEFTHPIKQELITIIAPLPNDNLWNEFENIVR
jgi:23S rRNA pseudouridine1911/1915/1917 synthase